MLYFAKDYEAVFDLPLNPDQMTISDLLEQRPTKNISGYQIKRIKSGDMVEVEIYPLWNTNPTGVRTSKHKPSRKAQCNLNDKNARKNCTRLMNTNFTRKDYWATFGYDDACRPDTVKRAQKIMSNYIKCLKRECVKKGYPKLKYIIVTEQGDTGKLHHHMVTNFPDRNKLEELWKYGARTQSRRLQPDDFGLEGLARYISENPEGRQRYSYSRNLVKPDVKTTKCKWGKRKIHKLAANENLTREVFTQNYPEYRYLDCKSYFSSVVSGCYLYVRMRKR